MSLDSGPKQRTFPWELSVAPPPEKCDDSVELNPKAWPERRERHYALVPTISFNCESACGLVAYVDKQTERVTKRLRKRKGKRDSGEFEDVSWEAALDNIGGRIRRKEKLGE
jgi:anaerobic selenocysteine-containing dehydrogenase